MQEDKIDTLAKITKIFRMCFSPLPNKIERHMRKLGLLAIILLLSPFVLAIEPVKPKGLIFLLHGCSQSDADFANSTSLEKRLKEEGYQVAYIQNQFVNLYRCWQWFYDDSFKPNSYLLRSYLNEIRAAQARYKMPAEKTYLIGFSSGASMALNIALCSQNSIGGLALQAGTAFARAETGSQGLDFMKSPLDPRFEKILSPCDPKEYKGHALVVHGQDDSVVHPEHSNIIMQDFGAHPIALKACDRWLGEANLIIWKKGSQNLQQLMVPQLGHEWGGGDPAYKYTKANAPSTTEAMIRFLKSL